MNNRAAGHRHGQREQRGGLPCQARGRGMDAKNLGATRFHSAIKQAFTCPLVNGAMEISETADFDDSLDMAVQQHPNHAAALAHIGVQVRRYRLGPDGMAQVILRHVGPLGTLALIPRGPVWRAPPPDPDAALRALRRTLPRRTALMINADGPMTGGRRLLPLITGQHIAEWDISAEPATLWAGLKGKWRNRLCRAQQAGLKITETPLPACSDHWLLQAEARQARRNGAPVAALLYLRHGVRATYQIGWTGAAGRAVNAQTLLLWQAALHLRDRGVQRFDLGTIDTETAPGLARFKLGTGARARALGATALLL